MKVFLVEVFLEGRLEPVAIKRNFEDALGIVNSFGRGSIVEMLVDAEYLEGVGVCDHWHIPEPNEEIV